MINAKSETIYVRHYPCAACGLVADEILNGHAYSVVDWPSGFFCSLECIGLYKLTHPNWKRDKDREKLKVEHNTYMRQFVPKEEWKKLEVKFDSKNDRYVSQTRTFSPRELLAIIEKYKADAGENK